jgi:hypothetical protein
VWVSRNMTAGRTLPIRRFGNRGVGPSLTRRHACSHDLQAPQECRPFATTQSECVLLLITITLLSLSLVRTDLNRVTKNFIRHANLHSNMPPPIPLWFFQTGGQTWQQCLSLAPHSPTDPNFWCHMPLAYPRSVHETNITICTTKTIDLFQVFKPPQHYVASIS